MQGDTFLYLKSYKDAPLEACCHHLYVDDKYHTTTSLKRIKI